MACCEIAIAFSAASRAFSSASVMSGSAAITACSQSSWPASLRVLPPPRLPGAWSPVRATCCISLIALDALTSKRVAAARREAPDATADTIRRRRSRECALPISCSIRN